ncbi:MAG: carboxypeptidase regulatory-like domain-containing protein [Candidatus Sulfotelmatobacter sp.]
MKAAQPNLKVLGLISQRPVLKTALVIAALFVAVGVVFGQGIVTGSISGTVVDPQGAIVAGAEVKATQIETNRVFTAMSSNAGVFQLQSLPPGSYNISIEMEGFSTYVAQNASVEVGKDTALGNVNLKVGNTAETVTVEGSAPLVESTTDQLSETFDNKQVASVPLGNTYDSFVLFSAGVATVGSGGFENSNGAELSINGQRGRSNNFQLDGQNNNDSTIGGPSIFFGNQDAIAELQVVTNFDAEYGRNMGGVVNYVTKNGTNAFHGTAYEFWQGDHFDSLQNQEKSSLFGYCPPGVSPSTGCAQPVIPQYVQNQFGGTVGGPIKRDKIWFFGSTNLQRNRAGGAPVESEPALTPDSTGIQELQAAFPNDPAVAALAQFGPATLNIGNPTFSNITQVPVTANGTTAQIEMGTLTRFLSQPFNDYEATGRVDFQLTSKDRFFTRYLFQQQLTTNLPLGPAPGAQGQIYSVPGRNQQIGLDLTHTFSPQLLNQVRFSYSRSRSEFDGGGFPTCVLATSDLCPPQIVIQDPNYLGAGQYVVFPQGRIINVYELQDNASLVHGKHVMKFGGEYDKQRSPNYGLFYANGLFTYPDFNSFIANTPVQTTVAYGQPVLRFKENDVALYFQDDWKIKDNLTLNLGLRWEFYQQASNLLHNESIAQQTGPNALWDTSLPLNQTTVPALPNHYRNYGPVVGFAWTPRFLPALLGNDKTIVRGGFRIAYDFSYYNLATNVEGSSPFTNLATVPNAAGTGAAGLPNVPIIDGGSVESALFSLAPKGNPGFATETQFGSNFRNPYSEQWNLGIQRQIGNKMAAEIRYVGNHDIGNFQEINGNPDLAPLISNGFSNLIPAGLTPCTTPGAPGSTGLDQFQNPVGYANCNYSRVVEYANTAYSIYDGLQTQLRVQNWHGFTGQVSYTFSKTIDNASEAFSSLSGDATLFNLAQNPFDISKAERALSSYDYPNVLGLLWVYDLPFRSHQSGFLGHIVGGWQINGTYRYTSGQPWTVVQNSGQGLCDPTDFTGGTVDTCRPILSSASDAFTSVGQYCDGTLAKCPVTAAATTALPYGALASVNAGCLNTGGTASQCAVTPISSAHWIINDVTAAQILGSPFLGVARDTERGQPISTANLAVFKNTRVTERLTIQLQAEAFNVLNHQWLGIPTVNVNSAANGTFGNLAFNPNGGDSNFGTANIITDGIGRRRLQFGAKVIF